MPIYEYSCLKCQNDFELMVAMNESGKKQVCPACGSKRTKKAFSIFGFSSDSGATSSNCGTCSSSDCATCNH